VRYGTSNLRAATAGGQAAGGQTTGAALTTTSTSAVATLSPTTAPVPTAADTLRKGGTLRFGNIGDFQTLEGQTLPGSGAVNYLYGVWDRLIVTDSNQQPQPMLAESWDIADDYRQIKFNVRHGVQFHTGRELTADDVKWSLQRIQDPKTASLLTGRIAPMIGVEAPDKYTVVVKASRPWVEAFDLFEQANVIDPVTFQAAGLSKPTGTGPFVFAEYVQGDHLRLVKNTNYWRNGFPYLDELLVPIHADAQAAVVKLEAGALDLIPFAMPVTDMIRLQKDPNYQTLLNERTGSSWVVYLNCTRAPTDNKLVRQALNYALDRQRMADTVWHGLQKPIALPWSSASPAYDDAKNGVYAFDLDKARSLLSQAGVAASTHLEIIFPNTGPEFATLAQIYQADLAKIGFDVTLRRLEASAYLAARNNVDYQGVQLAGHTLGNLKPASNTLGGSYGPERNLAGFKDDAYTLLVNQVVTETDPTRQRVLYSQLNDYYLDQSWVLPIVRNPEHVTARANVHGLRYDAHQALVPAEMWLT
jgi:peptide/nickel transport system substrate-binding protein